MKQVCKPSAENLKQVLWDTLMDLRSGKKDVKHANAVAQQGKTLLSVVRTELHIAQFVKFAGRPAAKNLIEFSNK